MKPSVNRFGQPIGFPMNDWKPPPVPFRETMQGRFCRLEPLDPDRHAHDLFAANSLDSEGRNYTYLPYGPFNTFDVYLDWMKSFCLGKDPLFFAIIDSTSEQASGVASYLRISPESGSIEVGHLHYSPRLQRSPATTEAMYLMMKKAFELGYRRYEWKCDSLNAPSRQAAQRLGFAFEGIFRQASIYKNRNRDTAWYSIIDREWLSLHDAFLTWFDSKNFDANGQQRIRLSDLTRSFRSKAEAS